MSQAERYDAVVVGSGEGGKYLAWHLAQGGEEDRRGRTPLDWWLLSQHQLPSQQE
jgi:flavin-dependent dehydrogenase